jgi:hypothetical protein
MCECHHWRGGGYGGHHHSGRCCGHGGGYGHHGGCCCESGGYGARLHRRFFSRQQQAGDLEAYLYDL